MHHSFTNTSLRTDKNHSLASFRCGRWRRQFSKFVGSVCHNHNIFWDISTFWDIDRTTLSITATFTYTRHFQGCRLVATVFISSEKKMGILLSVSVVSIGWWYESKNNPILILQAVVPWLLRTCSVKFNTKDPLPPSCRCREWIYLLINNMCWCCGLLCSAWRGT